MSLEQLQSFAVAVNTGQTGVAGSRLLGSIAAEVIHKHGVPSPNYNERYIDGGPAWGEHINYGDGGQHAETHRPK